MWAHYNFNRLNLFAALQIKCWVLFYATPAAKFHVQLSFVRHRQGARAAWEGVVCSSPFVFAKRVSFSLNLCLNLWFGNVYVVSKGSYHVPRCGNIKWREGEGESEVKILQCLLRFPVHICRAGFQKKGTQRSSADCDINWGNWVNGDAETAELLYPKDMLKSLWEACVCIAGDILPTLLRFFTVFNQTAINDWLLQILLHFLHKQLKTLHGKLPLQPLPLLCYPSFGF